MIGYPDVAAAAIRLAGIAHRTPVLTSRHVDDLTGARVYFKCESFQRVGAFKFRGAYNAVVKLARAADPPPGILAFSSGNHAQAAALAARLCGLPATIVMPSDAPAIKLAATRGYGAEVVLYDRNNEDRAAIAARLARERGLALIPPFDHPDVIAGQGTAAKELFDEVGPLDYLVVPVGGGGLVSGCALAAHALAPACAVIGVEPAAGNDVQRSLAAGRIIQIALPQTIADGAQTLAPSALTFGIMRTHLREVLTVTDAALVEAMKLFATRMKIVVEPTGCLGAAAVLGRQVPIAGKRVGVIVSGGNVDLAAFARLTGP